jgi:hypothetical protein
MMVHAYNPSTRETEAGGSPVPVQPGSQSETISQKKKKSKILKHRHPKLYVLLVCFNVIPLHFSYRILS